MLRNGVSSMSPWMGGGPVAMEGGGEDVALAAAVRATLAPRLWPQSTKRVVGDGG